MDAQRAQEITMDQEMIEVTCNGEKIYIEHVDQNHGLATIHPLSNPEEKKSVSVEELIEH
ncbi:small acid-soluble spore protein H (minor) [Amphibacillus marinus]|uniref:Small, acid-soluble spore protein H n=1 Tax=Amphibacillus marinus TaxID=872970 RepID=A0A1H8SKU1_9BACI|nr:H-type small acid-soluble spore protein [Amphibacillus marinus]SEO78974.1 small acid-soluble spore protein H (minor) [Amphibacillus marinus]